MLRHHLQHVFRNFGVRIINFREIHLTSINLCNELSTNTKIKTLRHPIPDSFITSINYAKNSAEVLEISRGQNLTTYQTMVCLRKIFVHERKNKSDVVDHPGFEGLCKSLQTNARDLSVNDIVDSIKIFIYLGLEADCYIMHSLLSLLRHQINDTTIAHIMFIDKLLKKIKRKTPLVEGLLIAMPLVFQTQLPLQMDRENVKELLECLKFSTENRVSEQVKTNIITALTLHGDDLTPEQAAHTLEALCQLKPYQEMHNKLIHNCFKKLNKSFDVLPPTLLDWLSFKLVGRCKVEEIFYNEEFFEKFAEMTVKKDLGIQYAFFTLKKFVKISFINIELLDYLLTKLESDPKILETLSPGYLFTLVGSLSLANYMPDKWKSIEKHVLRNPIFNNKDIEPIKFKFLIELIVLDVWKPELIEHIFQPDQLERYFKSPSIKSSYRLPMILYQVLKTLKKDEYTGPLPTDMYLNKAVELQEKENFEEFLKPSLKHIYNNFRILTNVRTRLGHVVNHVIVLDEDQNTSLSDTNETQTVEDLQEKGLKLLGVLVPPPRCFARNMPKMKGIFVLQLKTLETILPVVCVNRSDWNKLHEKEKIQYLTQLINEKLEMSSL